MQGTRGWRRWRCSAPGNEPHDSSLSNEEIRHLREALCLIGSPPLRPSTYPISSTPSTFSTSSTSTSSTSGGPLPGIQRLTALQVWRAPCPHRKRGPSNVEDF